MTNMYLNNTRLSLLSIDRVS